jgi:hypothetical protein
MSRLYLFISNFTHTEERQRNKIATAYYCLIFIAFICIFPIHYVIDPLLSLERHDRLQAYIFQYFHLFIFLWEPKNLHINMTCEEKEVKKEKRNNRRW